MTISRQDLQNWFSYHPPRDDQQTAAYEELRALGYQMATAIVDLTPPGPDQSAAIRKLRECIMTANAAIACGDEP
jgi:hypothetical protein